MVACGVFFVYKFEVVALVCRLILQKSLLNCKKALLVGQKNASGPDLDVKKSF